MVCLRGIRFNGLYRWNGVYVATGDVVVVTHQLSAGHWVLHLADIEGTDEGFFFLATAAR